MGFKAGARTKSSPTILSSVSQVTVCSSHVCCPTSVTHHQVPCSGCCAPHWGFPAPGLQSSITLPGARKRVTGSWGATLAPLFHSRQWSKYCPPFTPAGGPAIWMGIGRSCLAQEQPTDDGVLPHGSPRRWGIAMPHCIEVSLSARLQGYCKGLPHPQKNS